MQWKAFQLIHSKSLVEWAVVINPMNIKSKGNTAIENDVWIGSGVTILLGITIDDGAIIGTNVLITKNVEPYSVVRGNPVKRIRKRFDDDPIQFLLELKWWNWNIEKNTENLNLILKGRVDKLRMI